MATPKLTFPSSSTHSDVVHALVDSLLAVVVLTSRDLAVNLLIQAYAQARLTDVAFHVCRYVEEHEVSVVWSLVLHAKVAFGDLDSAWALFGEMVRKGFEPNAFVYTSFVAAFCIDGRVEEAIGLVREMEGKGLRPYEFLDIGFLISRVFYFPSFF